MYKQFLEGNNLFMASRVAPVVKMSSNKTFPIVSTIHISLKTS